jgi:serine/threonine-protein kinase
VALEHIIGSTCWLRWRAANNTGADELLLTDEGLSGNQPPTPYFFSPGGTELVFRDQNSPETEDDIVMLALDGNGELTRLLNGAYDERNAELSPDGRWMAYQSNETGRYEIYVRPFPNVDDDRSASARN